MESVFLGKAVEKSAIKMEIDPDKWVRRELFHIFHRLIHKDKIC